MTGWRLLDTGARDGAWNMAADVALMERARRTGQTVFRAYAWSRPTLSFGRHESTRARFSAARIAAADLDTVRRPTGGRALLHDHEVTYSVTAPVDAAESLGDSVRRINGILRRASTGSAPMPWRQRRRARCAPRGRRASPSRRPAN